MKSNNDTEPAPVPIAIPAYQIIRIFDGYGYQFTTEELSIIVQAVAKTVNLANLGGVDLLGKLIDMIRMPIVNATKNER